MQFGVGVLTGISATVAAVQLWFANAAGGYRDMYKDFGGKLPTLTSLVLNPAWLWGTPLLVIVMIVGVVVLRRTRPDIARRLAMAACVTSVVLLGLTYRQATAPMHELAGAIRSE